MNFVQKKKEKRVTFGELKTGEVFTTCKNGDNYYMKVTPVWSIVYKYPIIEPQPLIYPVNSPDTNPSITWCTGTQTDGITKCETKSISGNNEIEVKLEATESTVNLNDMASISSTTGSVSSNIVTSPISFDCPYGGSTQYVAVNLNNGTMVSLFSNDTTVFPVKGYFTVE